MNLHIHINFKRKKERERGQPHTELLIVWAWISSNPFFFVNTFGNSRQKKKAAPLFSSVSLSFVQRQNVVHSIWHHRKHTYQVKFAPLSFFSLLYSPANGCVECWTVSRWMNFLSMCLYTSSPLVSHHYPTNRQNIDQESVPFHLRTKSLYLPRVL